MGISGLWSLLETVKEDISLNDCRGKRLAVDLSGWIVQCSLVQSGSFSRSTSEVNPKAYLALRNVFFRALNLSTLGIILVFVIDGPQAPQRKGKHSRHGFYQESQQYKRLLEAMGFLVLDAQGEAEKMCAELNERNLVDGVLTSDGDALVYGARVVYKGMFTEKKEQKAERYSMDRLESALQIGRRDLVAFALLSKGDISEGVPSVVEKKFLELIKELKQNGVQDSLERLKSWSSSEELEHLEENQKQLPLMARSNHCTTCSHEGTKVKHCKSGCQVCRTEAGCLTAESQRPECMCPRCSTQRSISPHLKEIKIRRLALDQDRNFPQADIIDEFLDSSNTLPEASLVCIKQPNFSDIHAILRAKLNFTESQTVGHLVPWAIKMALHRVLPDTGAKPLRILNQGKENFEKCYNVKWAKLEFDDLSGDEDGSCYEFKVASSLFTSRFPDMAKEFEQAKSPQKGKRKLKEDPSQPKVSDFFKVKKNVLSEEKATSGVDGQGTGSVGSS